MRGLIPDLSAGIWVLIHLTRDTDAGLLYSERQLHPLCCIQKLSVMFRGEGVPRRCDARGLVEPCSRTATFKVCYGDNRYVERVALHLMESKMNKLPPFALQLTPMWKLQRLRRALN